VVLLVGLVLTYELPGDQIRGGGPSPRGVEAVFLTGGGGEGSSLDAGPLEQPVATESPVREFLAADEGAESDARTGLDTPRSETLLREDSADLTTAPAEPRQQTSSATQHGDVQLAQGDGDEGKSSRASGSGGLPNGYAHTGVFGVTGEGRKFVYVFDRSGSMDGHGGAPLSAAKSELVASLHDLDETHQFQIIFYNERPRVFSPTGVAGRLVFGSDQNKTLAEKFVGSITADGATRHEEALAMALKMAPDVIFFLTDADEPRLTADQLSRIARLNQGTSINTIEFGYGPQVERENFLTKLARQNAGKHVYVDVSKLRQRRAR
jgi:hypothetical protein